MPIKNKRVLSALTSEGDELEEVAAEKQKNSGKAIGESNRILPPFHAVAWLLIMTLEWIFSES